MSKPIGSLFGTLQEREIWKQYPTRYEFVIIVQLGPSLLILLNLLLLSDNVPSSGAVLELESQDAPGQKREWERILRIQGLSIGAAIKVKKTLSSMNFEEISILPTCSDGWIDILSSWRQKEDPSYFGQKRYGSPPTLVQEIGIPQ